MRHMQHRTAQHDANDPLLIDAMRHVEGRNKKILELRFKGHSLSQISKHFNVSRERIRQLILKMREGDYSNSRDIPGAIKGSTFKKVRERLPVVKALRDLGLDISLIAIHFNVGVASISRDLRRLKRGVPDE